MIDSLQSLRDAIAQMVAPNMEPPLFEAAFALGQLLQQGDVWPMARARLAELEALAIAACEAMSNDEPKVEAVLALLRDEGFHGNTTDYEDVENSFMDRVLEHRHGLPITLGVLAMHLAHTVGCKLEGIPFPGHFLVGVDLQGEKPRVFDPFHDGRSLSLSDLAELYRTATGNAMTSAAPLLRQSLQPAPTRAILSRMLRNLQRHYAQRGAHDRVVEVVGLLSLLHPEVEGLRTLQGKLHHRLLELN
jgi:regulator of sirC expression with transglutaminase-like and TPR domain